MGKITILNKHHLKCEDPDAIYIGRGSPLGNPYTVKQYGRDTAIELYKTWLRDKITSYDEEIIQAMDDIGNQVINTGHSKLVCFCKPLKCHGDVIADLVLRTIKAMDSPSGKQ